MNNYRQPYYRSSAPYGGRQAPEPSRCNCQNIAAVETSCSCASKPSNECSCASKPSNECSCDRTDMAGFALGMAYVPWQPWCNLYSTEQALWKGTLFQDLDLDFMGRRCG